MKKKILFAAQFICSAVIIFWVLRLINWKVFLSLFTLHNERIYFILPALILYFTGQVVLTLRWRMFLNPEVQAAFSIWELVKILFISRFFSNLLPGQFSSDSYRAYIVYNRTGKLGDSMMSVLFDRFSGMFAIFTISTTTIIFNRSIVPGNISLIVISIYVCLNLFILFLFINSKIKILERVFIKSNFFSKKINVIDNFFSYILLDRSRMVKVMTLSFLYQLFLLVTEYITFSMFAPNISITTIMVAFPLISTFLILPISINGLGQREAMYMYIYSIFGVIREAALSTSLMIFTYIIMSSLVGGAFYISKKILELKNIKKPVYQQQFSLYVEKEESAV